MDATRRTRNRIRRPIPRRTHGPFRLTLYQYRHYHAFASPAQALRRTRPRRPPNHERALALVGCASSHPITKSGEQCASCHSDGRAAVEGTGSASATETGLTFAVESGADEVYLCTAAVAEDGTVVPSRDRTLSADELGAVTVNRPGLYALCTGDVASPSATVLVSATESGPTDTVVKL